MPATSFLEVFSEMFGKITSFFDIFDLSFFVSGTLCLGAVTFWYQLSGLSYPFNIDSWMRMFQLIILCYVLGLISFSSGRWLRTGFIGRGTRSIYKRLFESENRAEFNMQSYFRNLLTNHNLMGQSFIKYYSKCHESEEVADCLYQRMWAEARQSKDLAPSLNLLNRWWVMAATYDGIAMSLIFYALIIIAWICGVGVNGELGAIITSHKIYDIIIISILVILAIASFREASRLERNQRDELVAIMGYLCHKPNNLQENGNNDQEWCDSDIT